MTACYEYHKGKDKKYFLAKESMNSHEIYKTLALHLIEKYILKSPELRKIEWRFTEFHDLEIIFTRRCGIKILYNIDY